MSVVLVAVVVAAFACGDDGDGYEDGTPIGDVTVTVYSDGGGGSHQFPGSPQRDAFVFVDRSRNVSLTDEQGMTVVPVAKQASTIHVLIRRDTYTRLYTITDVPVGASVFVGNRPPTESAGTMSITLPTVSGATYELRTPVSCISAIPQSSAPERFIATYRATCGGRTIRAYGFAIDTSGGVPPKVVEATFPVMPSAQVTLPGPYVDAIAYTLEVTNPPATVETAVTGWLAADGLFFTEAGVDSASAASADAIKIVAKRTMTQTSTLIARRAFVAGASTVDGTMMMAVPTEFAANGKVVSWKLDTAGRTVDGYVLETRLLSDTAEVSVLPWTVHGGATATSITAPTLFPPEVPAVVIDHVVQAAGNELTYYDLLEQPRSFDIDRTYKTWRTAGSLPENGVAFSVLQ